MALLLLTFAAIAVIWDFFPTAENEIDELLLEIEETPPPLNPYVVSSAFCIVGGSCLLIHLQKKRILSSSSENPPES